MTGELAPRDEGFSPRIAKHLSQDTAVGEKIISADDALRRGELDFARTDPHRCCWIIFGAYLGGEWTRPLWDRYQAIVEALLAMPMPTDE